MLQAFDFQGTTGMCSYRAVFINLKLPNELLMSYRPVMQSTKSHLGPGSFSTETGVRMRSTLGSNLPFNGCDRPVSPVSDT